MALIKRYTCQVDDRFFLAIDELLVRQSRFSLIRGWHFIKQCRDKRQLTIYVRVSGEHVLPSVTGRGTRADDGLHEGEERGTGARHRAQAQSTCTEHRTAECLKSRYQVISKQYKETFTTRGQVSANRRQ
ncbi:unnamed protein product [Danaus chrysippus]|uniref:(African queen) hypothetical protein n=1 Tax=Danaus chrysippus TaxID=151541 RepID=A0A8J2QR98_9NEOP|nr:unnamed protein product [Danaus chrysippus]